MNVNGGALDNTSTNVTVSSVKAGYNFSWQCINYRGTSTCGVAYYNQGNIASQPGLRENPYTQSIPTTVQVSNSQALQYTSIAAPGVMATAPAGGGDATGALVPAQAGNPAAQNSNTVNRVSSMGSSFTLPNSALYQINDRLAV